MSIKTGAVNPSAGKTKSQNATEVVDPKDLGYDPKKINIGLNAHKVAVRQAREKTLDQISAVDENFAKKRTETTEKIAKHNETIAGNKALIKKMYSNVNKDIASQLAEFDKEKNKYEKDIDKNTRKLKELQDELDTANAGLEALKVNGKMKRNLSEAEQIAFDKYRGIIKEAEAEKKLLLGKADNGKKLTDEEKNNCISVVKDLNKNQEWQFNANKKDKDGNIIEKKWEFEGKTQTELQEEVNKISKEEKKTQAKAKSLMSATDRKTVENKEKGVEKLRKEKVELNKVKYNKEKAEIDKAGAAVNLNYEATAAMAHEKAVNMFDKEQIIKGGTDEGLIGWVSDFRNHSISEIGNAFGKTALFLYGGDTTLPDKDNSLQALEADAKILNTLAENGKSMEAGKKALTIKENGKEKTVIVDEMTNSMHEYQATNDLKRNAGFEAAKAGIMFVPGGNVAAGGIHMMQSSANYKAEQIRAGNNNPTYWSTDNARNVVGDGLMATTYAALPFAGKAAEAGAAARGLTGIGSRVGVTGLAWGTTAAGADAGSQYLKTGKVDLEQTGKTFAITAGMGMAGRGIQAAAANPESVLNKGAWEGTKELGTGIGKSVKSGVVKTYEGAKGIVNSAKSLPSKAYEGIKSLPSKAYNRINNYRLNKTANAIKTEMTNNGIKDYTIRKVQLENGKSGLTCDYVNTDGKVTRITRSADNKAILKETYAEGTSVYQETITAKNAREIGMEKIDNGINDFTLDEVTFGNNQTGFIRCRYINKDGKLVEELYNAVTKKPLPKNVYGKDTPAYENYIKSRTAEPVAEQPAANAGKAQATSEPAETGNTGEQVKAEPAATPKTAVTKEGITSKDFESYQVGESVYIDGKYMGTVVGKNATSTEMTLNYKGYTREIKANNKGISIEPLKAPETAQVVVEEGTAIPKDLKEGMTIEVKYNGETTHGTVKEITEDLYGERNVTVESLDGTSTKYQVTPEQKIIKQTQKQPQKIREISSQKPEVVPSGEPQVTFKDRKIGDVIKINGKNAKIIEQSEHLTEQKVAFDDGSTCLIKENNLGIKIEPLKAPETAQVVVEEGAAIPKDLKEGMTIEIKYNGKSTHGTVKKITEDLYGERNVTVESPNGTVTQIETQLDGKVVRQTKNSPKAAVEYNEQAAAKTTESAPTQEAQATDPGTVTEAQTPAEAAPATKSGSWWDKCKEFFIGTPEAPAANTAPKTAATGNTAEASATAPETTAAKATAPENTVTPEQNTANAASEAQAAAPAAETNTPGLKEQAKEAFLETVYTSTPNKGALIINEGVRYYRDKQ